MQYLLPSHHFTVEWGGTNIGFARIRNLAMHAAVIESNSGASAENSGKIQLGQRTYEHFFLERTYQKADNQFYDWWNKATANFGESERRDITINLLRDRALISGPGGA